MPALQPDAASFNPNNLPMVHVATYERIIRAPLERVWENVLDWEHLPCLHETSFDYVEVDAAGDWGWRTWSGPDHQDHIELTVADSTRYVARSYVKGQQVSEIWTTLAPAGSDTRIAVEFHIPGVTEDNRDRVGGAMLGLYTRLWDEDEAMMQLRHQRLHETRSPATRTDLGAEADVAARLAAGEAPVFQLARREFRLRQDSNGKLIAHPTICPHLLGPLTESASQGGRLRCPWHGYEFDIETGQCVFPEKATCRLPAAPAITVETGRIIARTRATAA